MIKNKEEYSLYYQKDIEQTGITKTTLLKTIFRFNDRRAGFYKALRRAEYYTNCRKDYPGRILGKYFRMRYEKLCEKYQWTIPINVFNSGLSIVHNGPIIVSGYSKIGKNCRIHACVNIGHAYAKGISGAPQIGDNVYFGPGSVIFGPIVLGDNMVIGANSVVNSSFPEGNCSIAGAPAKIVSKKTSSLYIH